MRGKTSKSVLLFFLCLGMLFGYTNQLEAEDYLIGVEDVLRISVWETENLNLEVSVLPGGKISFPLVGDLQAAGLAPMQLREAIAEKLRRFIKDPIVTVIVVDIRSPKVYIQGKVNRPGTYILKRKTTILELLSDAGGVVGGADLERAYLLRNNQKVALDFYKLLEKGDAGQNIVLIPGDNIVIPYSSSAVQVLDNPDNFAKRITLLGQVRSPQVINFKEGLTVLDAILAVGGLTERADADDTTVIRKEGTTIKEIEVDMEAVIEDGDLKQNILLMPGDTVIVGESWF